MVGVEVEPPFDDPHVVANPWLLELLGRLLGDRFGIHNFGCVVSLPGAAPQHLHGDHPQLFGVAEPADKVFAITCMIPLLDLGEHAGCTAAWLGTHTDPDAAMREVAGREPFTYTARAGDCYLMDYRLLHAGGPNRSAAPRPVLYFVYGRSWFRDVVNEAPVVVSRERVAAMPAEMRRLFTLALPHHERAELAPVAVTAGSVLLVADDRATIDQIGRALGPTRALRVARPGDDVIGPLRAGRVDLLIVDEGGADRRGVELLSSIRADPELRDQMVLLMTDRWTANDPWDGRSSAETFHVSRPIGDQELSDFLANYIFE